MTMVHSNKPELAPLIGLNHAELQALADAVADPEQQQQLQMFLAKNHQSKLTPEEAKALDRLLAEADQIALLKARALYTMKRAGLPAGTN